MGIVTEVFAGYYLSREELTAWSASQAEVDPVYATCLSRAMGRPTMGVTKYTAKKQLHRYLGCKTVPKPGHGTCDKYCAQHNFLFYLRHASTASLDKFHSWHRVVETPADLEIKARLEELGLKLSSWSVIAWGSANVAYDLTPEIFEAHKEEVMDLLERRSPGLCPSGNPIQ